MGRWGIQPWENDTACDWYDWLFEESQLAQHIESALNQPIEDHADEIRAAAHILLALGENYIWPIDERAEQLKKAASQLQRILDCKVYTNSLLVGEVRREIRGLLGRVQRM